MIPCGADEPDEDHVRQALRGAVIRLVTELSLMAVFVKLSVKKAAWMNDFGRWI